MRVGDATGITPRLTDLAWLPQRQEVLALDEAGHQLLVLNGPITNLKLASQFALPRYPTRLAISPSGQAAAITSLWSRQLTLLKLSATESDGKPAITLTLPFPPRELLWLPGGEQILVAGGFRAELAVLGAEPLVREAKPAIFGQDCPASGQNGHRRVKPARRRGKIRGSPTQTGRSGSRFHNPTAGTRRFRAERAVLGPKLPLIGGNR